jgi:hypothetical protein
MLQRITQTTRRQKPSKKQTPPSTDMYKAQRDTLKNIMNSFNDALGTYVAEPTKVELLAIINGTDSAQSKISLQSQIGASAPSPRISSMPSFPFDE